MNLNPDTSLALMQQAQSQTASAVKNAKQAANDVSNTKAMDRIDEVAKDFEAMFVTEMMKPMFAQIKPDPTFGGGKGEEIFQGMMLEEYGKLMAETGQLGIADQVKKELIRMQGETPQDDPTLDSQDYINGKTEKVADNSNDNSIETIIEELTNE